MSKDEISNLELIICHLDLSVATKEKLYNQAHKIRNQLQQKENIIKEVREYVDKWEDIARYKLLEMLGSEKE